jgi:hypothetical protein
LEAKRKLNADLSKLASGAPRGQITRTNGNYGRDELGTPFYVESVAQRETRSRIGKQKGEGRKESFFFSVIERMHYVASALTPAQCGYLLVLTSHVNWNGLLVRSEKDSTPLTPTEMQKALGLTKSKRSTFTDFLDACLNHGMIHTGDDGS